MSQEVKRVGQFGIPQQWLAAQSSENLFHPLKGLIDWASTHAPEFIMKSDLSSEAIVKLFKVAFKRIDEVAGNWSVAEFIEKLKDDQGEYLFHIKKADSRPKTDNSPPATGVDAAFDLTKFQDSGSVDELIRRTRKFAELWDAERYYAPYFPILNASMVGKSRLFSEIPTRGVFTFTICLRPETDKSYRPQRSGAMADWATKDSKDPVVFTRECCAFFEAALNLFKEWLEKLTEKASVVDLALAWSKYMKDNQDSIWNSLRASVQAAGEPAPGGNLATVIDGIIRDAQVRITALHDGEVRPLLQEWGTDYDSTGPQRPLFVFVVDEAKQLKLDHGINGFTIFRRALRALPLKGTAGCLFFCLLTDTTSKVSNFSPAAEVSESARIVEGSHRLFPPFTVVNTMDIWADRARVTKVVEGASVERVLYQIRNVACVESELQSLQHAAGPGESVILLKNAMTIELIETYEYMATYGRAGLYAHLIGMNNNPLGVIGPTKLHGLLQVKLLRRKIESGAKSRGALQDDEDADDFDTVSGKKDSLRFSQAEVIGVLGAVASIDLCAGSVLATEVSAGHMRLISAISKLRNYVFTFEISEPVLALAAHELIRLIEWPTLLSQFVATQLNGATQLGIRGEYGFSFLTLMAYEVCMGFNATGPQMIAECPFPCLPLIDFLERFFGETMTKVSEETKEAWLLMRNFFTTATVRPNQFVKVESSPSQEMAYEFFLRGSVVFCKNNQEAVDFLIPVYDPTPAKSDALPDTFRKSNEALVEDTHARLGSCHEDLKPRRDRINLDARSVDRKIVVKKEHVSFILVQVKTGKSLSALAQKVEILDQIDQWETRAALKSPLVILFELKNSAGSQIKKTPSQRHSQSICPLTIRAQKLKSRNRFVIFIRDLKPSDIWRSRHAAPGTENAAEELAKIDYEFARVLEPHRKFTNNKGIDKMDIEPVQQMCRTQPLFDPVRRKRAYDNISD